MFKGYHFRLDEADMEELKRLYPSHGGVVAIIRVLIKNHLKEVRKDGISQRASQQISQRYDRRGT